jgi:hypothetical protein
LFQAHQTGAIDINANSRVTFSDSLRWAYAAISPWPIERIPLDCFPHLRAAALMLLMASKSGNPFVCKTHCTNSLVNRTRLMPYELTRSAVYMVRDPRDVVVSYANHFGKDYDEVIGLIGSKTHVMGIKDDRKMNVPQYPSSWSGNVASWTEDEYMNAFVVKYEDFLVDTKRLFTRMLRLWDVKPRNVDGVIEMCKFANLRRQEKAKGFLEGYKDRTFFNSGKSTWKKLLSKEQVARIINDHGSVMEKMGYI